MGRRRLPALLALVAGLLLGAGPGAQGVVAPARHPAAAPHARTAGRVLADHAVSDHAAKDALAPPAPHPPSGNAIVRAGHAGSAGVHLREVAVLPVLALLAVALVALLARQRRRSRPSGRRRSPLLARGPPLLIAR